MASNTFGMLAIATVTTAVTLSLTHYLLSRPWCIQLEPNGQQTILYGQQGCTQRAYVGESGRPIRNFSLTFEADARRFP